MPRDLVHISPSQLSTGSGQQDVDYVLDRPPYTRYNWSGTAFVANGSPIIVTTAAFLALAAANGLAPSALYNVTGVLYQALTPSTYQSFSGGSFGVTDSLQLDAGTGTYTGPAHYAPDHLGVWRYRHTNVPPLVGARLVYNWMNYSDTPSSWAGVGSSGGGSTWAEATDTLADGSSGKVMQVTLSASGSVAGAPKANGAALTVVYNSEPPIFWPGRIVKMRYDMKRVSGVAASNGYAYQRPVDNGLTPTESRANQFTTNAIGSWKTVDLSMQLNGVMYGIGASLAVSGADTGVYNVGRVGYDFASGLATAQALISSEYVPGGTTGPGFKYFSTVAATSRSSGVTQTTAWDVLNNAGKASANTLAGDLVDSTGAAISGSDLFKGFLQEPAQTNLIDADNWLFGVGWGKCAGNGPYGATVPIQSSPTTPAEALRYEVESMPRHPYQGFNAKITFINASPDRIDHADGASGSFLTDGWKAGDGVWAWMGNESADGTDYVGVVASVSAGSIVLTSNLTIPSRPTAAGRRVRLYRIPNVGDQVLALTNSVGGNHRTTVSSVTRPTYSAVATANFQEVTYTTKQCVRIGLTANPAADGGWAGADDGIHFFYWKNEADLGVTVTAGTGTAELAYLREEMRAAGLDDIQPAGVVVKLSRTTGNVAFEFGSASVGAASRDSIASMFCKLSSLTATTVLSVTGILTQTLTNLTWLRVRTAQGASVGAHKPRIVINGAGTDVYLTGMQYVQSALATAGSCPYNSSPLVNPMLGYPRTRGAKRLTWPWYTTTSGTTISKTNGFGFNFDFTPTQTLLGVFQCLAWVGTDADGFGVLLSGAAGDTWTLRKMVGGTPTDLAFGSAVVATAGTTFSVAVTTSQTAGMSISINGGTPTTLATTPATADVALTAASAFDLGSPRGAGTGATAATAMAAFGALRKTPSAAKLFG